jgi:hypothetical protein
MGSRAVLASNTITQKKCAAIIRDDQVVDHIGTALQPWLKRVQFEGQRCLGT